MVTLMCVWRCLVQPTTRVGRRSAVISVYQNNDIHTSRAPVQTPTIVWHILWIVVGCNALRVVFQVVLMHTAQLITVLLACCQSSVYYWLLFFNSIARQCKNTQKMCTSKWPSAIKKTEECYLAAHHTGVIVLLSNITCSTGTSAVFLLILVCCDKAICSQCNSVKLYVNTWTVRLAHWCCSKHICASATLVNILSYSFQWKDKKMLNLSCWQ